MTIATTAPIISKDGISAPSLPEIIEYLQSQYRAIFGADLYLEADSQDGQWLAILATAINDSNTAAIETYNAFSPATARNAGLSNVVKINGLRRQPATNSTVDLVLTGIAGTTINNGAVTGDEQHQWVLPAIVVIGENGSVTATATCQAAGRIPAQPHTVTRIATPTRGWQSVTNPDGAALGRAVELDGLLRQRQTVSTELPSQSILTGLVGAIANLDGVTKYRGYENASEAAENGIPAHSLALVVEGGSAQAIAGVISHKKTLGINTAGSTSIAVTDQAGQVTDIRFSRPQYVAITVQVNIAVNAGYLDVTGDQIKQAVAAYINTLGIGRTVYRTRLFVPANLSNDIATGTFELNNVQLADSGALSETDVIIDHDELATCDPADVAIVIDQ